MTCSDTGLLLPLLPPGLELLLLSLRRFPRPRPTDEVTMQLLLLLYSDWLLSGGVMSFKQGAGFFLVLFGSRVVGGGSGAGG